MNKAKIAFWAWLAILFVLNIIPLGESINKNLTGNKFIFRMDYLIHLLSFLVFGWIYFSTRRRGLKIFKEHEFGKFAVIILVAAVLLETLQISLPYRTFNPWDLVSNLAGAIIDLSAVAFMIKLSTPSAHNPMFK